MLMPLPMRLCSNEGIRKEGERLADEMLDKGFIPDLATYNRMIDDLSKIRDPCASYGG